jgi:hypothetical protein
MQSRGVSFVGACARINLTVLCVQGVYRLHECVSHDAGNLVARLEGIPLNTNGGFIVVSHNTNRC